MTDKIANRIIAKLATPPREFPEIDIEIAETTVKVAKDILPEIEEAVEKNW